MRLVQTIKLVRVLKMRVIIVMTLNTLFKYFTETFTETKRMSLGSKYNEMNGFHALLDSFINTHEAIAIETKDHKDGIIMNYVKLLSINTLMLTKKITILKR